MDGDLYVVKMEEPLHGSTKHVHFEAKGPLLILGISPFATP